MDDNSRSKFFLWTLYLSLQTTVIGAVLMYVLLGNTITLPDTTTSTPPGAKSDTVISSDSTAAMVILVVVLMVSAFFAYRNWKKVFV